MFKTYRTSHRLIMICLLLVTGLSPALIRGQQTPTPTPSPTGRDSDPLKALQWRSIGPFRGGRVTAVAGVASQPLVYYFGATGGGVWKTTDGGINWEPITDGSVFGTGSVGAIGLSDSDPNTIYVGMGESPVRGNVSHGDGVYKSMDAGKTWKRVGLEDTRQIGRVRVHPRNPDVVYVAALGHLFGPNEQRGIFRSKDGGKNWERVLQRGDKAGAIDLTFDPTNPNILYAGFWEVYRKPWTLESGGPGGGIFKSTDGGDTWNEITRNPGLPKGMVGKIGITVSQANPDRVWAIVEAEDGGVFRSDNAGRTWAKVNEERRLRQRAWYYTRIYADPKSADTVYVLNTGFYKSNDGGKTYTAISVPHGDNHDLWIAPDDPTRMINSNDGGANVSFNGGRSWTEQDQATAQFYRVTLDNDFPYNIYGAQQDNSTVRIASRTTDGSITEEHWYDVGGGESGWIAPSPKDSSIVFAGSYGGLLTRYDRKTGALRAHSLEHSTEYMLMGGVVVLTLIVIGYAYSRYVSKRHVPAEDGQMANPLQRTLYNKYYVDEIYDSIIVKPLYWVSEQFYTIVEKSGIDMLVNASGRGVDSGSKFARLIQNGRVGYYIFVMVIGIALLLAYAAGLE